MHRGYLKIWRKIEDNQSWSRGANYRGTMLTLLVMANWKVGHFAGIAVQPGQLACSSQTLANDLGVSRSTLWRILGKLEKDGFIKRQNMNNQFTLISIVNWHGYQGDFSGDEQPVKQRADNQRNKVVSPENNQRSTIKEDKNKKSSSRALEVHTALARQFQQAVCDMHGNLAPKLTDSLVNAGAAELEKAERLDGFSMDEMRHALLWAVGDDFWGRNARSLAAIRKPMKSGVTKLQGIIADYRKRGGGYSGTGRPAWAQGIGELL